MPVYYIVILYIIPSLILWKLSWGHQVKFTRLYRERRDPHAFLSPGELQEKYKYNPFQFFNDAPKIQAISFEIFWRDYQDKELNRLARKISLYMLAQTILIIFNFLFFAYYISRYN